MTPEERAEARARVSMAQTHLLEWVHATQREWMVFNTVDLIKSLPFPDGVSVFQQLITQYRDYRRVKPTGRKIEERNPKTGKPMVVDEMHGEQLSLVEAEGALRYLLTLVRELDPQWTLARL